MNFFNSQYSMRILLGYALLSGSLVHSAQIDLDTTFGSNGIVLTPIGVQSKALALALQPNSFLVSAGIALPNFEEVDVAVTAYDSTGNLDSSFGNNGIVTTSLPESPSAQAIALQTDGKIITTGGQVINQAIGFLTIRYNSDGSLDNTFGTAGVAPNIMGYGCASSIALQPNDNKIIVAGTTTNNGPLIFGICRYNSDGSPDVTFGSNGVVKTPIGLVAFAKSVALQSDGNIVVVGTALINGTNQFVLARYDGGNGNLDTTFGSNGIVIQPLAGPHDNSCNSIAIQPDDKIVVGGTDGDFVVARFNTDGTLDPSFGIATTSIGSAAVINSINIQSDGKIVATGRSDTNFAIARYNTDSSLDSTFGTGGISVTPIGSQAEAQSSIIQSDGKIVAAGYSDLTISLARYLSNNTPFITIITPANGSTITTNTTPLNGISSQSNLDVKLTLDSTVIGTTTTNSHGRWDGGTSPLLSNGSHTLVAELLNGATVVATTSCTFTVNATSMIAIQTPALNAQVPSQTITLSGFASEPADLVEIIIDGTTSLTATIDATGKWSLVLPFLLTNGTHSFMVNLKNGTNTIATDAKVVSITVPPTIVIQTPANGSTISGTITSISGKTTEANASITILADGSFVKSVTSDLTGAWSATGLSLTLPAGMHAITAHITNSAGTVIASAVNTIQI